tara:strand:+ start:136 stop:1029 length:894 start_codon:yes stop_codon:yes gene_type:complete
MNIITKILNPLELFRAYRFHKNQKKHIKSSEDQELLLYSNIISNDMLHYGYFDDINIEHDDISLKDLEKAQMRYIEKIIEQVSNKDDKILDVGCGMGGLSNILFNKGLKVESLTPDDNQKKYINSKYKDLLVHHMKFEDFNSSDKFGTVINSESLQYIDLDIACSIVDEILNDKGRWIITDYFRIDDRGINHSGHMHQDFLDSIEKYNWKIVYQEDITLNALPTLKFAMTFIDRFVKPLADFVNEKIKYKQAWLYYLTKQLRSNLSEKSVKELAALDPEKFIKEKKYMFYVLERKEN